MDPLYIVDFHVSGVDKDVVMSPSAVFERLLGHVAAWLNWDALDTVDSDSLAGPGRIEQRIHRSGQELTRQILWRSRGTDEIQVFQCLINQDLAVPGMGSFICEVTVFRDQSCAALRVEMGRETVHGLLTPTPVSSVRRPRLLPSVLRDEALTCRSQGQVVDGRFQWINPGQVTPLEEALAHVPRLPLLLIDGRREQTQNFAKYAASQLAGLAQATVLDGRALTMIKNRLEEIDAAVPDHGARLVWPATGWRNPVFDERQLRDRDRAVAILLKMVAAASVAARGRNRYFRRAVDATRQRREEKFQKDLAEARVADDAVSTVQTLKVRVEELKGEAEFWEGEAERLESENGQLRAAKSEVQYWKELALTAQQSMAGPSGASWQDAPTLEAGSLDELASFLTAVSSGAIVFTAAAGRSWKQSRYPHGERMRESLVLLAQAAVEWRTSGCQTGGMVIDDWFKTRWGLNMAGTDKGLRQVKGEKFTFDGQDLIREPHLKLDDHVARNEVGRVYFGLDVANRRFIVDHVGIKLY
ncbi:cell division protein ZapB [Amycolatopsis sp. NPDC004169]|uniref:cell division protein ZapB n=1 Tax=Amycolatopsis sp. NPDC004169 TaxID=3154453 RepID=UPI0033AA1289